jgi:hypothetical protein
MAEPHEDDKPGEVPATAAEHHRKKGKKKRREGEGGGDAAPAPDAGAEPRHVEPKHHARPAVGGDLKGDVFLETAATSIDKLRENWQVIAAGLLLLVVIVAFVAARLEAARTRSREGWEALRLLDKRAEAEKGLPAEEFLKGAEAVHGTSAEPYFYLRAGDAFFREGGKQGYGKAIEQYERVAKDFSSNPVAKNLAEQGIEAAKQAGTFDPAKAAAGKPRVETAKDLPPLPGGAGAAKPEDLGKPAPDTIPSKK